MSIGAHHADARDFYCEIVFLGSSTIIQRARDDAFHNTPRHTDADHPPVVIRAVLSTRVVRTIRD